MTSTKQKVNRKKEIETILKSITLVNNHDLLHILKLVINKTHNKLSLTIRKTVCTGSSSMKPLRAERYNIVETNRPAAL